MTKLTEKAIKRVIQETIRDNFRKDVKLNKAELSSVAGKLMEMRHARDTLARLPSKYRTAKQSEALKELSKSIPNVAIKLSLDLAKLQNGVKANSLISGNTKKDYKVSESDGSFSIERKSYTY